MITLLEVAKKANVSFTTASFVLNNRDKELRISSKTRDRVLEAAKELGYRKNELARAVGSGKSYVIGFVREEGVGELEYLLLEGVLKSANAAGYFVKLLARKAHEINPIDIARLCAEHRLAGLITRTFTDVEATTSLAGDLSKYNIPVVFVDNNIEIRGTCCITSDDDLGYNLTIQHLARLGHKHIVFLAGDAVHPQSIMRKQSYRKAMDQFGLAINEDTIVDSNWDLSSVDELVDRLFLKSGGIAPTALVCAGDHIAAIAIRRLSQIGFRVPADVSVIGYSDFSFSTLLNPPLTSISQSFEEIGETAVGVLIDRINQKPDPDSPPSQVLIPTKLSVRSSTGPPPRS